MLLRGYKEAALLLIFAASRPIPAAFRLSALAKRVPPSLAISTVSLVFCVTYGMKDRADVRRNSPFPQFLRIFHLRTYPNTDVFKSLLLNALFASAYFPLQYHSLVANFIKFQNNDCFAVLLWTPRSAMSTQKFTTPPKCPLFYFVKDLLFCSYAGFYLAGHNGLAYFHAIRRLLMPSHPRILVQKLHQMVR